MSPPDCAFGYSQARLQARLGDRPTAGDWQRIRASRDLSALLQASGTSSLARWTAGLDARAPTHDLERRMRTTWVEQVNEVARWQPQAWRAAILWMCWLPYLTALAKLARGGRAPNWMRADPLLGPIVATEPRLRAAALKRTPLAPLEAAFGARSTIAGAWVRHWHALWPAGTPFSAGLARIVREVAAHTRELEGAALTMPTEDAQSRLARRLLSAFRCNPLSPITAVTYLGLAALDLARLRGAIVVRALRAAPAEELAA